VCVCVFSRSVKCLPKFEDFINVRKRDEEDGSSAGVAGGVGGAGVERQMANADLMIGGRLRCSFKRITLVLCAGNLVVALYMLQLVVGPLYFQTSTTTTTTNSSLHGPFQQQEEISKNEDLKRLQESNDLRRAVLPVRLMDRIKEIEAETELEISKSQSASAARQKVALELAQQLRHLKLTNSKSNQ
jgi:hypothetical protein